MCDSKNWAEINVIAANLNEFNQEKIILGSFGRSLTYRRNPSGQLQVASMM